MPEVLTETKPLNVIFERGMERQRLAAERSRLEREVIEAARVWFDKGMGTYIVGSPLADAVTALIDFEA